MNPLAVTMIHLTVIDGSCIAVIYGCADPNSVNYNPNATIDNEVIISGISGYANPFALALIYFKSR